MSTHACQSKPQDLIPFFNVEEKKAYEEKIENFSLKSIFSSYTSLQSFFLNSPDITWLKEKSTEAYSIMHEECTQECFPESIGNYLLSNKTHIYLIHRIKNQANDCGLKAAQCSPVSIKEINDPKVLKRTFGSRGNPVYFDYPDGICSAICEWSSALYWMTKPHFLDPIYHIACLSMLFTEGGGFEATCLQGIDLRKGSLLHLKIGCQESHKKALLRPVPLIQKKFPVWVSRKNETCHQLQKLPPGAYQIRIPYHCTLYIKVFKKLGAFIEPNYGVFMIEGKRQGYAIYNLIAQSINFLKIQKTSRYCSITPVTLRNGVNP